MTGPGTPPADQAHLIATTSQNTVSVDGRSQRAGVAKVLFQHIGTRDEKNGGAPDFAAIQAESSLYEGVAHRRTLFHGPAFGSVLIVDALSSEGEHTYRQHFRMAPGLAGRPERGVLRVYDPSRPEDTLLRIDTWAGSGEEITWPTPLVSDQIGTFQITGRNATFITLLDLSGAFDPKLIEIRGDSILWKGSGGTFNIRLPIMSYRYIPWKK